MIDPDSITDAMRTAAERMVDSGQFSYDDAYARLGATRLPVDPRIVQITESAAYPVQATVSPVETTEPAAPNVQPPSQPVSRRPATETPGREKGFNHPYDGPIGLAEEARNKRNITDKEATIGRAGLQQVKDASPNLFKKS